MFTGIVQGTAEVVIIEAKELFQTHTIRLCGEMLSGLAIGASVAHNGCCLTVTKIAGDLVSFDLMQATLKLTNLERFVLAIESTSRERQSLGMKLVVTQCRVTSVPRQRSIKSSIHQITAPFGSNCLTMMR